ncbi:MAG: RNA 3'-terminal phosphate cyclase [Nitrososphaerota archaeon]|nr:RNA 3'-terminal phosphate cyclase [Candidatus Bathyarchaeota archaeon]MDW8048994.1 RNA 3'-terminal phosphate cyclase [Nitrososphaerota archaeon]
MLEIDGSQKSGSGTILRLSIALSSILGQPLHIRNIRKKRDPPGLRPQHLEAVLTAAKLCDAKVEGATLGSEELWFEPGSIRGGKITAEIGTAGSIPMLIMTVLPMCMFAQNPVSLHICKGGTDVRNSPTINYLKYIVFPMLDRMGLKASLDILKYGYYPRGMGEVILNVYPKKKLSPIHLEEFGEARCVEGISVCTYLADRRVAERQAKEAQRLLAARNYDASIQILNDFSNPLQKGSSIVLWMRTDRDALLGADAIGEIGKSSEEVAREAVANLIAEADAKATVDIHLGDILIPYIAFTEESSYKVRSITDHLETNVWLTSMILGVDFRIEKEDGLFRVVKI